MGSVTARRAILPHTTTLFPPLQIATHDARVVHGHEPSDVADARLHDTRCRTANPSENSSVSLVDCESKVNPRSKANAPVPKGPAPCITREPATAPEAALLPTKVVSKGSADRGHPLARRTRRLYAHWRVPSGHSFRGQPQKRSVVFGIPA
jgi:hypothetical protein